MSIALAGSMRYARALRSRSFALLWAGQTISALGDGTFYTAMAWQVLILTGSGAAMAGVTIAGIIPRLVFFLIGGVTADRFPRRLIMLWSDTSRAVIVFLIALLGWTQLLQLWHLIALALIFGVVDGFFSPAYQAIIPQVVEKEALASANALTGISQKLGFIVGPLLGAGSIIWLTTPASAFAFDGLTFVASALCLLVLRLPTLTVTEPAPAPAQEEAVPAGQESQSDSRGLTAGMRSVFRDAREGLAYVMHSGWLRMAIVISALCNIAISGPSQVASPKLVYDAYGQGVWLLGALIMANSIGSIIAMVLVSQLQHLRRRGLLAFLALAGISVAFVAFGLPLPHAWEPVVSILAATTGGFCLGFFSILWITLMQEKVPGDKLGRVSSIDMLGSLALLPVGYALAGVFTDLIGPAQIFIIGGVLNLLLCLVALSSRHIRQLE